MNRMPLTSLLEIADTGTWGEDGDSSNGSPILRSSNIQDYKIIFDECAIRKIPTKDKIRKKLRAGDILVTASSGSPDHIGKCALFFESQTTIDYYFSNFTLRLRPNQEKLVPSYLYYWLVSPEARKYLTKINDTTSGLRNLNRNLYLNQLIPVPPLEEQRRIAEILDKADALREKRRQSIAMLDTLVQSVFLEMFGDPVTNPKGWPLKHLSDLGSLERGKSKHRPRNAPELLGGPYPLIQTGDIANSDGYIKSYTQTYSKAGLSQSRLWPARTLCITIAANIGKTAILTFDACFPDSIVGFTPNNLVTTEFIQQFIAFRQKELEEYAPESAQKNINLRTLSNLIVPTPPKFLQEQYTSKIINITNLKDKLADMASKLEDLFYSIQHQAFQGSNSITT